MSVILFIIAIIVVVAIFKRPGTIGQIGEAEVARRINHAIRKGFYVKILQNVYIYPKQRVGRLRSMSYLSL